MLNKDEFKLALIDLKEHITNDLVKQDNSSKDFRIYENSQKVSLTNYRFLEDKRVFQEYLNLGLNEKQLLNKFSVLLGALKALKNNDEVLSKLKNNFLEYKEIIDDCGCVSENEESSYVMDDPENNFAAFWDCNELGKLQLRYIYNEVFGVYFSELIIEYPSLRAR